MSVIETRFVEVLDEVFNGIVLSVGAAVVLTVAVISYGVLAREVFGLSDVWVTDVTTYLMGYMTFVGAATLAWQGRHLKIEILGHYLAPWAKRGLDVISCAIVTSVSLMLLWLTAGFWWDAWDSNERSWGMFSVPLWIPYLSLLAGALLLALAQIVRLATLLRGHAGRTPESAPDNVARN